MISRQFQAVHFIEGVCVLVYTLDNGSPWTAVSELDRLKEQIAYLKFWQASWS